MIEFVLCPRETDDLLNFRKKRPREATHIGPDQLHPVSFNENWIQIKESTFVSLCLLSTESKKLISFLLYATVRIGKATFC